MFRLIGKILHSLLNSIILLGLVGVASIVIPDLHERYLYTIQGQSIVRLTETKEGNRGGTGFLVEDSRGTRYTMTNAHICRIADELIATKMDGTQEKIAVIEISKHYDLCLMEPISGVDPLRLASKSYLHSKVWLVGYPGLRPLTIQSGRYIANMDIEIWTTCNIDDVIIQLDELESDIDAYRIDPFLARLYLVYLSHGYCIKPFFSAHINSISYEGNSGSPVFNVYGHVIGVLFAGNTMQNTSSYMVPLKHVKAVLEPQ